MQSFVYSVAWVENLCQSSAMPTLPALLRAARVGLDLSLKELAEEAGVHFNTVHRYEQHRPVSYENLLTCQATFERRGIEFIELGGRGGLILRDAHRSLALRFRAARASLDLSTGELARLANLNPRTILNLEAGKAVSKLTEQAVGRLLRELGVDMFETHYGSVVMLPPRDQLALIVAAVPDETD